MAITHPLLYHTDWFCVTPYSTYCLIGSTTSTDLVTTSDALQRSLAGPQDAFVVFMEEGKCRNETSKTNENLLCRAVQILSSLFSIPSSVLSSPGADPITTTTGQATTAQATTAAQATGPGAMTTGLKQIAINYNTLKYYDRERERWRKK